MYINAYGCDNFPSQYVTSNLTRSDVGYGDEYYKLRYGRMILPVCNNPEAQPVLSIILFISFITLCGFILINITIAAVTAGINDRLDELRKEDLENEMIGHMISHIQAKSSTVLTDPAMLLMLMKQVWKEHDDYAKRMSRLDTNEREAEKRKRERQERRDNLRQQVSAAAPARKGSASIGQGPLAHKGSLDMQDSFDFDQDHELHNCRHIGLLICDLRYQSMFMRDLTGHMSYTIFVAGLVVMAALTEMWTLQYPETKNNAEYVLLALQILFTMDLYCKVIATYPNYQLFFKNGWSLFDTVLVIATWAPVLTMGMHGQGTKVIGMWGCSAVTSNLIDCYRQVFSECSVF